MADNPTIDNGALTDYVVATDDDGTAQHQYVKLEYGGDGTFTKVTDAAPLPTKGPVVDNAAFTDGTTPVDPVGYIFDEVAGTALTENDAAAARIDSKRAQVIVIEDATTRGQRASVTSAGGLAVGGSVASGVTDAGNPVKIGGRFNTTPATVTDGQRVDIQTDNRGHIQVTAPFDNSSGTVARVLSGSDGATASTAGLQANARSYLFNGTSEDRQRANVEATLLASAVRAVTTNSADQVNYNGRGTVLVINVTVEAAAETLSLKVQGKDPVSGNYYDIVDFGVVYNAAADAPTTTRAFAMYVGQVDADYVGITGNGTLGKGGILPRIWRAVVTHSASGNWTYSLGSTTML